MIDCEAGTDGIDRDVHLEACGHQVEHGLLNADVRFDAADEDAVDALGAPGGEDVLAGAAAEGEFAGWRNRYTTRQIGQGWSELFRILFGGG